MNEKIWIVEDELSIAQPLIYTLEMEGFKIRHFDRAYSFLEALKQESASKPDFFIFDIGLPDLDGFNLWRKIKDDYKIPMLFLTARSDEIDRILGLEMGADDYVTKPFSPREVTSRIRNILKRVAHASHPINTRTSTERNQLDSEFIINPEEARIYYQNSALYLTRYEYHLLAFLIKRPFKVYSRSQLMDHVWSEQEDTFERTVDTHIKTLRAKLRQVNADCKAIITHRGFGYSLRKEGTF